MAMTPHKYTQMILMPDHPKFGSTDAELRAEAKDQMIATYGAGWVFTHEERHAMEGTDPAGVPYPPGTFVYTSMWMPA